MVFGYFRDAWNYYFGNRYPGPSLVLALKERSDQTRSTAVVPYREDLRIIRQPTLRILRPLEEDEKESWIETHPSSSDCVRRLQIHEEI